MTKCASRAQRVQLDQPSGPTHQLIHRPGRVSHQRQLFHGTDRLPRRALPFVLNPFVELRRAGNKEAVEKRSSEQVGSGGVIASRERGAKVRHVGAHDARQQRQFEPAIDRRRP